MLALYFSLISLLLSFPSSLSLSLPLKGSWRGLGLLGSYFVSPKLKSWARTLHESILISVFTQMTVVSHLPPRR